MEGNLSMAERALVEEFCFSNPDLAEELEGDLPSLAKDLTEGMPYKSKLKQHEDIPKVNLENYEYYFALQEENKDVKRFLEQYPEYENDLRGYLQIKLQADTSVQADKDFLKDFMAIHAGAFEHQKWIEEIEAAPSHRAKLKAPEFKLDKGFLYDIAVKGKTAFPWRRLAAVLLVVGLSAFSYTIFNRDFEGKVNAEYAPKSIKGQFVEPEINGSLAFDFYQIKEQGSNKENRFFETGREANDIAANNSSKDSLSVKEDSLNKIDVRIPIRPKKDIQDIQIAVQKDSAEVKENYNTIAANDPYVSKTKELGWKDVLVKGAEKITGKEVAFVEDLPDDDEKRWSLSIGRFGIERVKD
jgi:hypothetical protein